MDPTGIDANASQALLGSIVLSTLMNAAVRHVCPASEQNASMALINTNASVQKEGLAKDVKVYYQ